MGRQKTFLFSINLKKNLNIDKLTIMVLILKKKVILFYKITNGNVVIVVLSMKGIILTVWIVHLLERPIEINTI
jgi:hypothetical protein